MSVLEPPQFTPAQVLEAGRRAETEGRSEYAIQFYRHLVDTYPGTGEAAAAQGALSRIIGQPQVGQGLGQSGPPPIRSAGPQEPQLELPGASAQFANPFDPLPYQPQFGTSNFGAAPGPVPRGGYSQPAGASSDTGSDIELPDEVRDYLTGRILARLFAWLGGLMVLAGFAVVPASIVMPRLVQQLPFLPSPAIAAAAAVILGGLFIIMLAQLVRALLDQANATRDLAALTRAHSEARQPRPARGRRR